MLIRFLLLIILAVLLARAVRGVLASAIVAARGEPPHRPPGPARGVKMVRDPVCGTFLPPGSALSVTERGTIHYFCSVACRDKHARSTRHG